LKRWRPNWTYWRPRATHASGDRYAGEDEDIEAIKRVVYPARSFITGEIMLEASDWKRAQQAFERLFSDHRDYELETRILETELEAFELSDIRICD
jgi:hypothetical protein